MELASGEQTIAPVLGQQTVWCPRQIEAGGQTLPRERARCRVIASVEFAGVEARHHARRRALKNPTIVTAGMIRLRDVLAAWYGEDWRRLVALAFGRSRRALYLWCADDSRAPRWVWLRFTSDSRRGVWRVFDRRAGAQIARIEAAAADQKSRVHIAGRLVEDRLRRTERGWGTKLDQTRRNLRYHQARASMESGAPTEQKMLTGPMGL
jgi:hypothetical protein